MRVPGELIPIVLFVCVAATAIFMPMARAYAKRMENESKDPVMPPDVSARLERMEQALDSIAIEVERISEGQRFTTKLLSERKSGESLPGAIVMSPTFGVFALLGGGEIPPEAIQMAKMFFLTITVIALGIPIIRMITRRIERGPQLPPPTPPDVTARLERIEQAVEAVAIEVERIAEAQRFSAKLMAEQQKRVLPAADREA